MNDKVTVTHPLIGVITNLKKQIIDSLSKGEFLTAKCQMNIMSNLMRGASKQGTKQK